eukprot:TRINITY_DN2346_c0_g1_i1.p1 TRINITY_DN2346_c0_g1~~TRINITY_DN2346_c0_g1_i1.p1  ORF type:complete len:193 (+),score=44.82 TRINITY_DN2346_c0_g1_i1:68-646(+)
MRATEQAILRELSKETSRLQGLGLTLEGVCKGLVEFANCECHNSHTVSVHKPAANNKSWTTDGPPFMVATPLAGSDKPAIESKYSTSTISPSCLVVDLFFKDRWRLLRSTREYDLMIEDLEDVFIGTFASLTRRVSALADALKKVFDTREMDLPPWRTTASMSHIYWFRDAALVHNVTVQYSVPPPAGLAAP